MLRTYACSLTCNNDSLSECGKKCQCSKGSRTDCKSLSYCSSGVPDSIKFIGAVAHLFPKFGHFSQTTGIICNRPVSINCKLNPGCCKHTQCGNCYTIQPGKKVSHNYCRCYKKYRERSRHHTCTQSCY